MENGRINVNYLPDAGMDGAMEYSIDSVPITKVLKAYINGDTLNQFVFTVRSVAEYGSDTLQNIANCGFYEQLSDWLEEQNEKGNFPNLPQGKEPEKIQAQSTGYLFISSPNYGKYQIQCRLIYRQKGKNYE